jgi:hypothetical protein
MVEAKAFRTFIRIYFLFKNEFLNASFKLTFYKALIKSVMAYACPACKLAADSHFLKLQRLQKKVLRTIGKFPRCPPARDLHTALNFPYVYDYIIELCRRQTEVIQNHANEHVHGMGQGEARHKI